MRLDLSYFFKDSVGMRGGQVRPPPSLSPPLPQTSPAGSPWRNVPASKAAFLCVKESVGEDLEKLEELKSALQHAGYNPTQQFLGRYWTEKTESVSYAEFHYILQTEPLPRKLDLISYFRQLDPNGEGVIEHKYFLSALTTRGEKLSKDLVEEILKDPKFIKHGKFDYEKFCQDVFDTSADLTRQAKERVSGEEENLLVNSKTYKVKRKTPSPLKSIGKHEWSSSKLKGAFYFEGETIISHQYIFKVHKAGNFEVAIKPIENQTNIVDCQLYLFKLMDNELKGSPDSKVRLIARSQLLLWKKIKSSDIQDQQPKTWPGNLEAGLYLIIPTTTGCRMKKRGSQPQSDAKLVSGKGENMRLTKEFSETLTEIFRQVDLDGNGTLSRTEFNLFNWRTSGEEVQDEEWAVVRDNFALENNELTLQGFLQLHQMEAEDNGGDSAELWITLNAMGYNAALQQDEASIFEITVRSEEEGSAELEVSGLKSGGTLLDKATIRCIMHDCKEAKPVDKAPDVLIYRADCPGCTSFVVENRSADSAAKLNLDFGLSENALINHPHLAFQTGLSPKSTVVVAHLIPKQEEEEERQMQVRLRASRVP